MRFSLIVPVYNIAPYIGECIDSVVAQSYSDWELICVDDGSSDDSLLILEHYARFDKRISVIHQENSGVSSARNVAIPLVTGDWVWFVDGDDIIHPDALKLLSDCIAENRDVDLLQIKMLEGIRRPQHWDEGCSEHSVKICAHDAGRWLLTFVGPSQFLLKSCLVRGHYFLPYKRLEDVIYTFQCFCLGENVLITDLLVYFYRIRQGSAIHSEYSQDDVRSVFSATKELIQMAKKAAEGRSHEFVRYWKKLHALAFFTFRRCYFDLNLQGRKSLFPEWLSVQKQFNDLYRVPLEWRCRMVAARYLGSGLFVRFLILFGSGLRGHVSVIIQHIRRIMK